MFRNLCTFSENFGNGSKVIFRWFYDFLKFSENLRKSSEVVGNLRKSLENFEKRFKSIFQMFLWFFKIFRKSSEIVGRVRKTSLIFRKLQKRFKSNLQMFLWCFKTFGKSSEVFGNLAIFSLVKIWKISYSGPGCTVMWILWMVYFPVKHCCKYNKIWYGTVMYDMVWYGMVWYVWFSMGWYCMVSCGVCYGII